MYYQGGLSVTCISREEALAEVRSQYPAAVFSVGYKGSTEVWAGPEHKESGKGPTGGHRGPVASIVEEQGS